MTGRVPFRWATATAAALATAATGLLLLPAGPASATTVNVENGAVTVTVDPTTGLADGRELTIKVESRNGVQLNQVTANLCAELPTNNFSFSTLGATCADRPLSPAHEGEKATGALEAGTTATTLTYKVGTGSADMVDMFTNETRHLRCGPGEKSCLLGLWIQETSNPEVFVAVPLTFGGDAPAKDAPPVEVMAGVPPPGLPPPGGPGGGGAAVAQPGAGAGASSVNAASGAEGSSTPVAVLAIGALVLVAAAAAVAFAVGRRRPAPPAVPDPGADPVVDRPGADSSVADSGLGVRATQAGVDPQEDLRDGEDERATASS